MAESHSDSGGHKTARMGTKIWVAAALFVVIACVVLSLAVSRGFKGLARVDCGHNLVLIGLKCREYAAQHDGHFPSNWFELNLVGDDANWAKLLHCPLTRHEIGSWPQVDQWADYRLLPGRSTNDAPNRVLAIEPLANHGGTGANVLFVDGTGQWWPASSVLKNMNEMK